MTPRKSQPPTPEEFVAALKAYLARHKISQGDLGKQLGRSRVTVARWISGKQVPDELTRAGVISLLNK